MSGKFVDYYYYRIVTCNRFEVALIIVINERTREILKQTACTLLVGERGQRIVPFQFSLNYIFLSSILLLRSLSC